MRMTWSDLLTRPRPVPTHEIKFDKGDANIADLWMPDCSGPHRVVLMVHGGCWQKAIADRSLMNYAAEELRQTGFAVWNIEYRGVDEDGGGYPGIFLDVAAAADALRDHAVKYNLSGDNIIAFGHSAGGHLALWLAARTRLPAKSPLSTDDPLAIRGVVNSGGLADLEATAPVTEESCLSSIMDQLTGPPSGERPNVFADTSPAELLPLGIEQVSINGDRDHIAPPVLGRDYTAKVKAAGDAATFYLIDNTGHVELIAPGTAAFTQTIKVIKEMAQ